MIKTNHFKLSVVLDADDLLGKRVIVVHSLYTGRKLGTIPYNKIIECYSHPDELDDYVNSNMKFS